MPVKSVLVGTHVCCLLRDGKIAALFLSCTRGQRAELELAGKTPGFHLLRNAPQVLQTPSKYLNPGSFCALSLIQGSIITPLGSRIIARWGAGMGGGACRASLSLVFFRLSFFFFLPHPRLSCPHPKTSIETKHVPGASIKTG